MRIGKYFGALLVGLALYTNASSAVITATPAADAIGKDQYASSSFTTVDFISESSNNRQVGNVPQGGATQPEAIARSVFEFDLIELEPHESIVSVELSFEGASYGEIDKTVLVSGYQGDGVISGPDFLQSTNLISSFLIEGGAAYSGCGEWCGDAFSTSLDVTAYVSALVDSGTEHVGFNFSLADESQTNQWVDIIGTGYPGGGSPSAAELFPRLIITTVPVPGAVWFFGSALAGLGWMRKKQAA